MISVWLALNALVSNPTQPSFVQKVIGNLAAFIFTPVAIECQLAISSIIVLAIMIGVIDRRSFSSLGFTRSGIISDTFWGMLAGTAIVVCYSALMLLLGYYWFYGLNRSYSLVTSLALFLFASISEESVFRGYILQTVEARWGTKVAVAVSSLAFGLYHIWYWKAKIPILIFRVFYDGMIGVPLAAAYLVRRRLWMPIGLHWGYDLAWSLFAYDAFGNPPGLVIGVAGPAFFTGGRFGAPASPLLYMSMILASLILIQFAKRPIQQPIKTDIPK